MSAAFLLAPMVGVLFAAGAYLLLQRSLGQIIIGLALLSNGVNLLLFVSAGVSRDGAPLIQRGELELAAGGADPLPQALVLTAIVIGFGVLAFFIALAYRAYRVVGDDSTNLLNTSDRIEDPPATESQEAR
jgi:multicomponent Na+:H+ antiporter subunit C